MNFILCDGEWGQGAGGEIVCTGQLSALTVEEFRASLDQGSGLTWEDAQALKDEVLILFAGVFAFLVLKKLL
ncbi:hypothetical protein D9M69_525230 [compost metagenome]